MKVHAEAHDDLQEISKRLKVPMTVLISAMTRTAKAAKRLTISIDGFLRGAK